MSVGDYVLTGGELPALVLIDAAARLVPGVLGDPESICGRVLYGILVGVSALYKTGGGSRLPGAGCLTLWASRSHSSLASKGIPAQYVSTATGSPPGSGLDLEDRQLLDDIIREGVPGMPVRCGEEG